LRRVAVTLIVVVAIFVSGTGLVRAASTTLPGDNLYPVKRTWEDVLLLFTFNLQEREGLEVEHENERLHELQELFAEGRSAEVDFVGLVTSQNGNEWLVAGIPVVISAQTEMRGSSITIGSPVRVKGQAQGNGSVFADRVELLPSGAILPELNEEPEIEKENQEAPNQQNEESSGKESAEEAPKIQAATQTPESGSNIDNGSLNDSSGGNDSSSDNNSSPDSGSNHDSNHDSTNSDSSNDSGGGGGESGD